MNVDINRSVIIVVPEIIVIALCSIGCRLFAGDGKFVTKYWMELWIRNTIPTINQQFLNHFMFFYVY